MYYRILGPVRVWRGDSELPLGPPKQQPLLALLLPGPQSFPLGYSNVVSVQLTLKGATALTKSGHIALAEVEFFKRG